MGFKDETEGAFDKGKGKAKEAIGDLKDDPGLEAEGKKDQLKGGVKQGMGNVKDAAEDLKDAAKDATS